MVAPDKRRDPLQRALERASHWMFARTVALFARATGGNPVLEGTGILIRIADAAFVVSAAHVVAAVIEDGRQLLMGVHGSRLLPLEGLAVQISEDREDVDAAFIRLPPELVETISRHKVFARLSEIDIERNAPSTGGYAVLGFPGLQRMNSPGQTLQAETFQVFTGLHDGGLVRFTAGQSIALQFEPHMLRTISGEVVRPPALKGISGCGIWRVISANDHVRARVWNPEATIRLAGIEHGTLPSAINLGGHPKPASEGHLKTGQS